MPAIRGDRQTGEKIVACIIVAFITAIKLGGTDYIVKASTIFFFFSMTPSVIFMVWGSKDINPEELINTDTGEDVGGYNAAQLFSWVTWLYCGFNSLGALAGEVSAISFSTPLPPSAPPRPFPQRVHPLAHPDSDFVTGS